MTKKDETSRPATRAEAEGASLIAYCASHGHDVKDVVTFRFVAACGDETYELTVFVADDDDTRTFADLADEAYERACAASEEYFEGREFECWDRA